MSMKVLAASCVLFLSGLALAAPSKGPSLAILNLEHKNGVSADVAELITANLTTAVSNTTRFGRVIGTKEIESVIGFEKQKQLLSCESQSCVAELAGAMGVDYVLTGTLGRLGNSWLFNITLVSTHSAEVQARISRRIPGTEEALLEAMDSVVAELFKQMPGAAAAAAPAPTPTPAPKPVVTPAPAPAPAQPTAQPASVTPAQPAPSTETPVPAAEENKPAEGGGVMGKALMGVGGVGVAGAVVAALLAVAGVGVAGGSLAALMGGLVKGKGQLVATGANAAVFAGGGVGALSVLGVLVLGAAGVGLLVAGVVLK
jgi:TolB-like protein